MKIEDEIKSAGRELGMRRNVFPKWVKSGRMTQAQCDHEIGAMASIYERLKKIKAEGGE